MKSFSFLVILMLLAVSINAELMWDNDVTIRSGVNIEWFRTGIDTNDGCAIYVWSDTKLGARDLYAQKVDAQGNMVWGDPLIVDQKADRQEDPVITRTSDGDFIIAWIEYLYDQNGDVFAQKVSPSGQLMWQVGGMPVCTLPSNQISLNIEPDNAGGAYIIWEDSRNPGKDLYGQRLDTNGNPVWTVNGNPIANSTANESQNTMWADGEGGMIIAYLSSISNNSDIFVKRFLPNGTMPWTQMVDLTEVVSEKAKIRMAPLGNGEFVFAWEDKRLGDPDIFLQKLNLNGQKLWPGDFRVYADADTSSQISPRIVQTSDTAVIVVWEDRRLDPQNPDLFAQKVNASGQLMWNPNGIQLAVDEFAQDNVRMAADNEGGTYIVWEDSRNGNVPNIDVYAQRLSSTGAELWTSNGKPVCTAPNEQSGGLIKVANDHIFVNWMDMRNGSVGLNYQVLTPTGNTLLAENGVEIFWGLSGDAVKDQMVVLPRDNDAIVIWQDSRYAVLGYQIFMQIIDADGNKLFNDPGEENGRPITMHTGATQLTPAAVVLPDGSFVVTWAEQREDNPRVFAQMISATGERLWGDYGMPLTDISPYTQQKPKVTYENGALYFGWSHTVTINSISYNQVFGQKIVGGQKMWGPDGVLISHYDTQAYFGESIIDDMKGRYFVWTTIPASGGYAVVAKLVTEDGETAPGWPDEGLRVSTYNDWDILQTLPQIYPTPDGAITLWSDYRFDFSSTIYGQHISAAGSPTWDPLGIPMADYGREQEGYQAITSPDGFTFVWCESIGGMLDVGINRYSFGGSPLWGPLGFFVVERDTAQSAPAITRFSNTGMLVAWVDYFSFEPDLCYKYVEEDGDLVGPQYGYVLSDAPKSQYNPLFATLGTQTIAVWSDGRTSGKTEILGIHAQKINNELMSVADPSTPLKEAFTLKQNYPNPFNPETRISFDLNDNREAVELAIYNSKGQRVKTLYKGALERGAHDFLWKGIDDNGKGVGSGIYFYKLSNGKNTQTRKMVLMK
ncbi:MAG: FlgD immunoglobulin-like domain containing protein [Candidatus Cloacimonetes bacterium]|nr:FlgD immunoglobulin-like domain containing protein [Candidatus Cloacimonadota bacterium]